MYTVTVMPNKHSIYFPALLGLRNRSIKFLREVELSKNKIVFDMIINNDNVSNCMKLHYDEKKPSRQHALIKQKKLVQFMETVHDKNKWICYMENEQLILEPEV